MLPPYIREKVIPRLHHFRKTITDKGASESEKQVAEKRYHELMSRYKITEEMLEGTQIVEESFNFDSAYEYILLTLVAQSYGQKLLSNPEFTVGKIKANKKVLKAIRSTYEKSSEKLDSYFVGLIIHHAHCVLPEEMEYIEQDIEWNPYEGDEANPELKLLNEPLEGIDYDQYMSQEEQFESEDFIEEEILEDFLYEEPPQPEIDEGVMSHKTLKKLYIRDEKVEEMILKMRNADMIPTDDFFGGMF